MLQTIVRIPLVISLNGGEWPLFGPTGILFSLWVVLGIAGLAVRLARRPLDAEWGWTLAFFAAVAVGLAMVPRLAPNGIPIYGYGLMLFLGFLAAAWLALRRAPAAGIDPNTLWDLVVWVFLGGIVGARLFFVVQYRDHFDSLGQVLNITQGGLVYYGGVIGAVVAFAVYVRWKRLPALALCDLLAPSVALGQAFGRVGCFLNGCCYGDVSKALPWAVQFPASSAPFHAHLNRGLIETTAAHSLPVHPTQLYSAVNALILCGLLLAFYPWRRRNGEVIGLLMFVYPVTRFLIESLRDDEAALATGLTISQNLSILLLAGGVVFWLWLKRRPALGRSDSSTVPSIS